MAPPPAAAPAPFAMIASLPARGLVRSLVPVSNEQTSPDRGGVPAPNAQVSGLVVGDHVHGGFFCRCRRPVDAHIGGHGVLLCVLVGPFVRGDEPAAARVADLFVLVLHVVLVPLVELRAGAVPVVLALLGLAALLRLLLGDALVERLATSFLVRRVAEALSGRPLLGRDDPFVEGAVDTAVVERVGGLLLTQLLLPVEAELVQTVVTGRRGHDHTVPLPGEPKRVRPE